MNDDLAQEVLEAGCNGWCGAGVAVGDAVGTRISVGSIGIRRKPAGRTVTVPLPVPPVLKPVRREEGIDYYEITQRVSKQEILPGLKTEVWGYEGIFPGPTIEARRGRKVVVRQINELTVPVAVHLHGGITSPDNDGYPTDLIPPAKGRCRW